MIRGGLGGWISGLKGNQDGPPATGIRSLVGTGHRSSQETVELAANSKISLRRAKAAGPARPNVSWLSGTNRHAPVPVRLYLSRLSESFPLAVAPVSRAAALTAEAANRCFTHMSATIRRPGSSASRSPRSGSRQERGGSGCAAAWTRAAGGWAVAEGMGGPEGPAGMNSPVQRGVVYTYILRCSLGYYKGRVSVVCVCYSLLLSSVCYTVVLRYSSMIM